MLLILLLIYYFAFNFEVPTFVPHDAITKGLSNLKLDKRLISPSKTVKSVKLFKDNPRKVCSELFITGKENISCENIARVMLD